MSAPDKGSFLSRWSRRKLDLTQEKAASKPAAPAAAPTTAPAPAATPPPTEAQLPPVDSLRGLASEYKDFLRPEVDEKLRQAALKKLFHDPHFNVMDGLDTYIDDYSKPDPIPEAMLEKLKQANRLLFPEEAAAQAEDRPGEAETGKIAAPDAETAQAGDAPPSRAVPDGNAASEPGSPSTQESKSRAQSA